MAERQQGECTFPLLRCETQDCWQLTRAFLGRPHPEPLLNLPWNNSLMWHAVWHKTHSHLSLWMPQLYYKDTFSERISSFHKKKKQTEQGSATRAEKLKTAEQVSPLQLLKGMTTSTQRQPCVCLGSVDLFNPQSVTQRETTFRAIHRHKGPRSEPRLGP